MTGTEFNRLIEGDKCILTEDIDTSNFIWHKDDIIEVVYARPDNETMYFKNYTTKYGDRPSYKALGVLFCLKAMEKYKSWKDNKVTTTFKHKFNPGDTVWYMKDNKPFNDTIVAVRFTMEVNKEPKLRYITLNSKSDDYYNNNCELFATKDELLDSLR